MSHPLVGTVDGNIVRLDEQPPLPSGCRVTLTMKPLNEPRRRRAKVGETSGPGFKVPDEAVQPLSEAELREWGL